MADRLKLRVIGRSEVLPKAVLEQAAKDLPFDLEFILIDSVKGLQRVVTSPETFDVYHQWHTVDLIWTARAIQAIDLRRVHNGHLIQNQALTRQTDARSIGSVFNQLFLQPSGRLGATPSDDVVMLPLLHGVDAFGYHPSALKEWPEGEPHSWGWLLDPRLRGRVAMMSDPVLGMIEAALAVEAAEKIRFADVGNLTVEEIDTVADILLHKKKLGHFKTIWNNYEDAARSMQRGVVLQSMFSPAIALLRSQGIAVSCAVPQEGYRGWHVDLCISSAASGEQLDAAYAYLNWWMNGKGGAVVTRQGYYFVLPDLVRPHLAPAEWDYWYAGKPAETVLTNPAGLPSVAIGDIREGGSYFERMSRVRVWNTFMDEHTYLVRRWREFLEG
ncbi:ABC transporter substrate-binding protein [Rhizobium leguminosarum]|uniref:ABC transporter substrate-binding protein n=1 Tax=Rhizobium TaxID=379 RepID=UPI00102FE49B|nr:extracellular solute-binding protein [Rhizobium leguminosarum]TBF70736.1 signal peptide prediction [Rhizobium leguminosarum]TBG93394.1 signal peptide prediction [Rhizobium leguminosarum]TBG95986.1 signal peptide prediction [Rhizobium leguminosarum]TBH28774.1 signal peptide prediction [Rhizobium leguminosarum]TBH59513.1 signal peptide prediction [Rhizobium leguminosarum]